MFQYQALPSLKGNCLRQKMSCESNKSLQGFRAIHKKIPKRSFRAFILLQMLAFESDGSCKLPVIKNVVENCVQRVRGDRLWRSGAWRAIAVIDYGEL